jgi:hypothetical protein
MLLSGALETYDISNNPLRINLTHPEWYIKEKIVYPPFKDGLYLEEYFFKKMAESINANPVVDHNGRTYFPLFWTNYQLSPHASVSKLSTDIEEYMRTYPPVNPDKGYFTLVQHDDGPLVQYPPNRMNATRSPESVVGAPYQIYVYGASNCHIPLIYEDQNRTLIRQPRPTFEEKHILCSFVGSITHRVRNIMLETFARESKPDVYIHTQNWTPNVLPPSANHFIEVTRYSKFTLAPRGYGVQSFRFYEAFELGSIPVYIHDQSKTDASLWLPYQNRIDYHKICIIWHIDDIDTLIPYLRSITQVQYDQMQANYHNVKQMFTLDYMCESILHGP